MQTEQHLWNIRERLSRGPKPSLTVDLIVAAAIDGIGVLVDKTSMQLAVLSRIPHRVRNGGSFGLVTSALAFDGTR
jgi:hypothetical protein